MFVEPPVISKELIWMMELTFNDNGLFKDERFESQDDVLVQLHELCAADGNVDGLHLRHLKTSAIFLISADMILPLHF